MNCRHCNTPLKHVFLNLGLAPHSNAYLGNIEAEIPEPKYPLKLFVCDKCWLVQTEDYSARDELFTDEYAYFSSVSSSWLKHSSDYSNMIIDRLNLNNQSFVLEVASNDGYLLQYFQKANIPCLGVEPTESTAQAAELLGIRVKREFFGSDYAKQLIKEEQLADLIIGNNVYAHVPDINDFTKGLKTALKPEGTITLEFPHLLNLINLKQFDTVYHEHYSYLSLYTVSQIFNSVGLRVYNVEKLTTHGGSLRVFGCHMESSIPTDDSVLKLLEEEKEFGLQSLDVYLNFQKEADKITNDLIKFLREQKTAGKSIGAYGAAAKGNTLLNYGKINADLISFVCDAAPSKQGKYLPGSHIPILPPSAMTDKKPDWIIILPWNLEKEIIQQQSHVKDWGGNFVIPIPELKIV
ncbi:class I SAM-dependent methyltransferase [uncultured Draconibacterium sp.]|uniref:class I SAM-dependent methyltransferase n=1 Tax=uncultured Draconibacterium sp. TaxID=1573823 RepID=UPI0029C77EDD|nr:class I SAM-dependent methyltransferase [uncultured Draconibacterium sp.]